MNEQEIARILKEADLLLGQPPSRQKTDEYKQRKQALSRSLKSVADLMQHGYLTVNKNRSRGTFRAPLVDHGQLLD